MKLKLTVKNKTINSSEKMSILKLVKSQLAKHALNIRKVDIQINDLLIFLNIALVVARMLLFYLRKVRLTLKRLKPLTFNFIL